MKHLTIFTDLIILLVLILFTFAVFTPVTLAQDPTTEPTTAPTIEPTAEPTPEPPGEPTPPTTDDLLSKITALIATAGGLIGSILTNLIKRIPGLSEGDKTKLTGAAAEVVAVVVSVVTGAVLAFVAQGLGLIDDSSLQALVVAVGAPIVSELRYRLAKLSPQV